MAVRGDDILLAIEIEIAEDQAEGDPLHALPPDSKPDAPLDKIVPILLYVEGRRLVGKIADPHDQPSRARLRRGFPGEGPGRIDAHPRQRGAGPVCRETGVHPVIAEGSILPVQEQEVRY